MTDPAAVARERLARLFDQHHDDLHRYCLARSGELATAEDVVAETFTAAARTLAARPDEPIDRPWLFVVAKRRLVDHWRASGRERRRIDRLVATRGADGVAPSDEPDGAETADRVLVVLTSLPPRQRAALALRYLDELSVAEVADQLDVTYAAADSLLARGRRGFSRAWREHP